jgi:NAD(P)-dependent dehydrogenase (short-subunit alcohol dehydrogenase family)
MNSFANKVAIITGAGQGIGKAIAQTFSHHEVHVIIAEQDEEAGKETQQWIQEKGGQATFIPCDVAREASERQEVQHREIDKKQHLVGRVGTPEDIGRAVVFLCSGESSFITGQNMVIDGGMTVKMIYEE